MHYEINVSLNGFHLFATNERSLRNVNDMRQVYQALRAAFPATEGYDVSVVRYTTVGEPILNPMESRD